MPTITVPDAVYDRLARRAAALGTTPDALADQILEQATVQPPAKYFEWLAALDAWMAEVDARADRYPPGHVTDVSRESMYEGCGE